jgi:hypothetical protein
LIHKSLIIRQSLSYKASLTVNRKVNNKKRKLLVKIFCLPSKDMHMGGFPTLAILVFTYDLKGFPAPDYWETVLTTNVAE